MIHRREQPKQYEHHYHDRFQEIILLSTRLGHTEQRPRRSASLTSPLFGKAAAAKLARRLHPQTRFDNACKFLFDLESRLRSTNQFYVSPANNSAIVESQLWPALYGRH